MFLRKLLPAAACLAFTAAAAAGTAGAPLASGIDESTMDTKVRPQDDLCRYMNGTWLANTPFPAEYPSAGIGVISLPPEYAALDPAVDPVPDDGMVSGNVTQGNGSNPDYRLAPFPAGDVIWDGTGTTCFEVARSAKVWPSPLPTCDSGLSQ